MAGIKFPKIKLPKIEWPGKPPQKPAPKKQPKEKKIHPWRPCPLGQHWVSAHTRHRISSRGLHYIQSVDGHCRNNGTRKDHLYRDDIHEIASKYFAKLHGPPVSHGLGFTGIGNKYDHLIRGWTRYWNDVLRPSDLLDPDIVKALIASESSFNPNAWNRLKGKKSAYGLMQVLNQTVPLLSDPKELKDHFVNLTSEDMKDPNISICSGVRWLFRKKQLAEAKAKKSITWREAIIAYKVADKKLMKNFDKYYRDLKSLK
ncbi:MAG: transglycosylase SLT domain-containing protein [Deltaproteobacteria bacterium]|nr:transglycosylase SLT domain-containing protein [Deltaproteobacteria bacterium]